jgi:hypothetical protein
MIKMISQFKYFLFQGSNENDLQQRKPTMESRVENWPQGKLDIEILFQN